jgi:hypothetical protein
MESELVFVSSAFKNKFIKIIALKFIPKLATVTAEIILFSISALSAKNIKILLQVIK